MGLGERGTENGGYLGWQKRLSGGGGVAFCGVLRSYEHSLTWRESNYQIADFPIYTTTLDNGGGYVVSPGFFHPALLFSGFVVSHYQRGCNPAEVARRAAMLEYSRDATELNHA